MISFVCLVAYLCRACHASALIAAQAALGRDTGDPTAGDEVTAALLELYSVLFHAALTDPASGQALLRHFLSFSWTRGLHRKHASKKQSEFVTACSRL